MITTKQFKNSEGDTILQILKSGEVQYFYRFCPARGDNNLWHVYRYDKYYGVQVDVHGKFFGTLKHKGSQESAKAFLEKIKWQEENGEENRHKMDFGTQADSKPKPLAICSIHTGSKSPDAV